MFVVTGVTFLTESREYKHAYFLNKSLSFNCVQLKEVQNNNLLL